MNAYVKTGLIALAAVAIAMRVEPVKKIVLNIA